MSEETKQLKVTATETAQELANAGKEVAPSFQFVVVALDTKNHIASLASSHREKIGSKPYTDAEVEQLYRHFIIAEKLVGDITDVLERLMEERGLVDKSTNMPVSAYRH